MNSFLSRQGIRIRSFSCFLLILFHVIVACIYVSFFHYPLEDHIDPSSTFIRKPETLIEQTQSIVPIATTQQPTPKIKASDANARETKVMPVGGVKLPSNQKNTKISSNKGRNETQAVRSISINNPNAPDIAWLMSFPNSGTTYTSLLIHELTHTTTANVYGSIYFTQNRDKKGSFKVIRESKSSLPIYFDRASGPYMLSDYPLPTRSTLSSSKKSYENHPLILTKTHCSGYCHDCTPARYVSTKSQFFQGCRTGLKVTVTDSEVQNNANNPNTNVNNIPPNQETQRTITKETVRHDPTLVKKAVHLIRNPFDNVAARFHHAWKLGRTEEITNIKDQYAFDTEGFHNYCAFLDKKYIPREREWYSSQTFELAQRIPCHAEFYRYIQWHNLAFETTRETMNIPSIVISYEHYKHHLDATIGRLLQFLNLQQLNFEAPKFEFNRCEYKHKVDIKLSILFQFFRVIQANNTFFFFVTSCVSSYHRSLLHRRRKERHFSFHENHSFGRNMDTCSSILQTR